MKSRLTAVCALLLAVAISACSSHGMQSLPTAGLSGQGGIQPFDAHGGIPTGSSMQVQMQDAPPVIFGKQLAHFNVAIREVDVTDSKGHDQVLGQYGTPLIVDVLKYQNGSSANVGGGPTTDQTYRQIRFIVDVADSQAIFNDNSVAPLNFIFGRETQSEAGAGKTTITNALGNGLVSITDTRAFTVRANVAELVSVDFNLFESLGSSGRNGGTVTAFDAHGGIPCRPALFVVSNYASGEVTGTVVNQNGGAVSNAVVVAIGTRDTVGNSVATDANGNFDLHGLSAGDYRIDVYNEYTNAAGASFTAVGATSRQDVIRGIHVTVTPGLTASAGTITD